MISICVQVGDKWKDAANPCILLTCGKEGIQTEVCSSESYWLLLCMHTMLCVLLITATFYEPHFNNNKHI